MHREQCMRSHDHARNAEAALCCLKLYECALQRAGVIGTAKSFEGDNLATCQQHDRGDAREYRDTVDHDGASAALSESASVFGCVQRQLITQYIQQGRLWIGGYLVLAIIDVEANTHDLLALSRLRSRRATRISPEIFFHGGLALYRVRR